MVRKIEETRAMMARVRFEVEQKVDLMGGLLAPPFETIQDIECRKHSISIGGDLEGADVKIIYNPSEI